MQRPINRFLTGIAVTLAAVSILSADLGAEEGGGEAPPGPCAPCTHEGFFPLYSHTFWNACCVEGDDCFVTDLYHTVDRSGKCGSNHSLCQGGGGGVE